MRKSLAAFAVLIVALPATLPVDTNAPFPVVRDGFVNNDTVLNGFNGAPRTPKKKTWHGYAIARIC